MLSEEKPEGDRWIIITNKTSYGEMTHGWLVPGWSVEYPDGDVVADVNDDGKKVSGITQWKATTSS